MAVRVVGVWPLRDAFHRVYALWKGSTRILPSRRKFKSAPADSLKERLLQPELEAQRAFQANA